MNCTLGGMIGNNSCGATAQRTGKVVDNIAGLEVLLYDGTRYPGIPRRVSGYNLDSLLPEHGFDVAGLRAGSESTLVTVLRAELKLVPVQSERSLVVLGYPSIDKAADALPSILPHDPIALEGLYDRLIHDEQAKHMNAKALKELPRGTAYLM